MMSLKKIKYSRGFTLVELLAVMVVVVTVTTLINLVLTSALVGTNKTKSLNEVRQNGNYALLQMSKMIGYAKNMSGVSIDGIDYIQNCAEEEVLPLTPTPTPSRYNYIKIVSFDNDEIIFSCSATTIASNGASLIDNNAVSLDTNSCWFTCMQKRISDVPTIGINFSLSKKTTSRLVENKASIPFQTSVTMRNLGK